MALKVVVVFVTVEKLKEKKQYCFKHKVACSQINYYFAILFEGNSIISHLLNYLVSFG